MNRTQKPQARSEDRIARASKKLSWLLRHGAATEGLDVDPAGWVPIDDVLKHSRLSRAQLDEVVRLNNKSRLQVDGARIRACQGHSLAEMPVDLDALEASWRVWPGTGTVWHGTSIDAVPQIAREGLRPGARTHVHLAPALDSGVGKRANVHVLLEVDPARLRAAGIELWEAQNGVVLARHVPPACIIAVRAETHRARQAEPWRAFDLPGR
ncbi:MAG: RNA 2'-phosphotransferase [Myxococcales bacterium]|nr:RNA 2'-phosphotransferase [Myxococcales bacterium]